MNPDFRLLLLGLLLACGPLKAAEAPAGEGEAAGAEASAAQEEQAAEQAGEEVAAEEGEEGEAAAADSEGALVLEDENFVPSVQISEDLSVSFPVDI